MSDTDPGRSADPGSQSGNGQDWVAELELDDTTRESLRKTTFKTREDLAKGYLNLQSKLGKSVQLPGENATEEQRIELFKKLGMPDSFEGYDLSRPQDLPEGLAYDEDFENAFRSAAHKSGLTKAQARGLYNWYNTRIIEQVKTAGETAKQVYKKAEESLRTEWGENFEKETTLTRRFVEKYGGQDLQQFLDQSGLGNDLRLIRAFNKAAHAVGEDSLIGGEGPGAAPQRQPGVLNYPSMKGLKPEND
jgi:hypothetical protein